MKRAGFTKEVAVNTWFVRLMIIRAVQPWLVLKPENNFASFFTAVITSWFLFFFSYASELLKLFRQKVLILFFRVKFQNVSMYTQMIATLAPKWLQDNQPHVDLRCHFWDLRDTAGYVLLHLLCFLQQQFTIRTIPTLYFLESCSPLYRPQRSPGPSKPR